MQIFIDLDFESYSECDISKAGSVVYSEHPSTRIISVCFEYENHLYYWMYSHDVDASPAILKLKELAADPSKIFRVWNVAFELPMWYNCAVKQWGVPPVPLHRWLDQAAVARFYNLPGKLETAAEALRLPVQKNPIGNRVIQIFSKPRRMKPRVEDVLDLGIYNAFDVKVTKQASEKLPYFTQDEWETWQVAERINFRGVHSDQESISAFISEYEKAIKYYDQKIEQYTNGDILKCTKTEAITRWVQNIDPSITNLEDSTITEALERHDPESALYQVLEARKNGASASVRKLYKLQSTASMDHRIRCCLVYNRAHTGRAGGSGIQPQNFPNSCDIKGLDVEDTIREAKEGVLFDRYAQDGTISERIKGCLRGMLCAAPGKVLHCSDWSAIEAVGLAMLSGEEWRIEVFRTHGLIYEMGASMITGIPLEDFIKHEEETGEHHPMRKKIGKISELGSGYQGSVGAWKGFDADKFMTDDEILANVKKWRAASPMVVRFWYKTDECAIKAVERPGVPFEYRGITWQQRGDILFCRLWSGRELKYWYPSIGRNKFNKPCVYYWFNNTNPKKGKYGWIQTSGYGGSWTENITQATCYDLLTYAWHNCENNNYPLVLHIHDEVVAETDENFGSYRELEEIMMLKPDWAKDWPIKASRGYTERRFKK